MRKIQSWSDFIFNKGRYLPSLGKSDNDKKTFKPYQEDKTKLVWNVFNEHNGDILPINIFEYHAGFLKDGLLVAKKKYKDNFEDFANHVRSWLQYYFWSKCEYETVITSWPPYINDQELERINREKAEHIEKYGKFIRESTNLTVGYKIDIYTQVMMNWDRFIEYLWNNKHLITSKKLGLK